MLLDVPTTADHIICFSTTEALTKFSEATEVFVDGTSFSCPSLLYQLLTVSIVKDGFSFNVAYLLLPGKSLDVYVEAFEHFRNAVAGLNLSLSLLELVQTDFETALHQAVITAVIFIFRKRFGAKFTSWDFRQHIAPTLPLQCL